MSDMESEYSDSFLSWRFEALFLFFYVSFYLEECVVYVATPIFLPFFFLWKNMLILVFKCEFGILNISGTIFL